MSNDIEARLKLEADTRSARRAGRSVKDLEGQLQRLGREAKDTGKTFSRSFGRSQVQSVERVTDSLKKQERQLQRNARTAADYDARRSRAASRFGRFGDVGTGLSTVGSVFGGGVGSIAGLGADIADLTEQAGLASAQIPGLSGGIGRLATVVPLAGAALGGLALAANKFVNDMNKQADQIGSLLEGRVEASQSAATMTRGQIQQTRAELESRIEAARASLQQTQSEYDAAQERFSDKFTEVGGAFFELTPQEGKILDSLKEQRQLVASLREQYDEYGRALERGTFMQGEAAQQQTQYTQATQQYQQIQQSARVDIQDVTRAETERSQAARQASAELRKATQDETARSAMARRGGGGVDHPDMGGGLVFLGGRFGSGGGSDAVTEAQREAQDKRVELAKEEQRMFQTLLDEQRRMQRDLQQTIREASAELDFETIVTARRRYARETDYAYQDYNREIARGRGEMRQTTINSTVAPTINGVTGAEQAVGAIRQVVQEENQRIWGIS